MYTQKQRNICAYTKRFVAQYFKSKPAPGHDFGHAKRVAAYAVQIAKKEKTNVFLAELAGWLHDLGRSVEYRYPGVRHHDLSYDICRKLFRTDRVFVQLSDVEKKILLYSVKYHWNDAADAYAEAYILRDADKLDAFGAVGNKRAILALGGDKEKIAHDFRLRFAFVVWLRTPAAKKILISKKLLAPMFAAQKRVLLKQIEPVSL